MASLENLIRKETGLNNLKQEHIAYLSLIVKDCFETNTASIVFYIDSKQKKHLYIMPTNSKIETSARKVQPISSELFKKYYSKTIESLNIMLTKTDFFDNINKDYKIQIVRKFPIWVIKSEKLNDKTNY